MAKLIKKKKKKGIYVNQISVKKKFWERKIVGLKIMCPVMYSAFQKMYILQIFSVDMDNHSV